MQVIKHSSRESTVSVEILARTDRNSTCVTSSLREKQREGS